MNLGTYNVMDNDCNRQQQKQQYQRNRMIQAVDMDDRDVIIHSAEKVLAKGGEHFLCSSSYDCENDNEYDYDYDDPDFNINGSLQSFNNCSLTKGSSSADEEVDDEMFKHSSHLMANRRQRARAIKQQSQSQSQSQTKSQQTQLTQTPVQTQNCASSPRNSSNNNDIISSGVFSSSTKASNTATSAEFSSSGGGGAVVSPLTCSTMEQQQRYNVTTRRLTTKRQIQTKNHHHQKRMSSMATVETYSTIEREEEAAAAHHEEEEEQEEEVIEVDFYNNPTMLSRLILYQKYDSAMQRLQEYPQEAMVWLCSSKEVSSTLTTNVKTKTRVVSAANNSSGSGSGVGVDFDVEMITSQSTHTFQQHRGGRNQHMRHHRKSYSCNVSVNTNSYSLRQLPIHVACTSLAFTEDSKLREDLELLILRLVTSYPAGCGHRDHQYRLPLHEAILNNASPQTVSMLLMACPESVNQCDQYNHTPLELNSHRNGEYKKEVADLLLLGTQFWEESRRDAINLFSESAKTSSSSSNNKKTQQQYSHRQSYMSTAYSVTSLNYNNQEEQQIVIRRSNSNLSMSEYSDDDDECNDSSYLGSTSYFYQQQQQQQQQQLAQQQYSIPPQHGYSTNNNAMMQQTTTDNNGGGQMISPMAWEQLEKRTIVLERLLSEMYQRNFELNATINQLKQQQIDGNNRHNDPLQITMPPAQQEQMQLLLQHDNMADYNAITDQQQQEQKSQQLTYYDDKNSQKMIKVAQQFDHFNLDDDDYSEDEEEYDMLLGMSKPKRNKESSSSNKNKNQNNNNDMILAMQKELSQVREKQAQTIERMEVIVEDFYRLQSSSQHLNFNYSNDIIDNNDNDNDASHNSHTSNAGSDLSSLTCDVPSVIIDDGDDDDDDDENNTKKKKEDIKIVPDEIFLDTQSISGGMKQRKPIPYDLSDSIRTFDTDNLSGIFHHMAAKTAWGSSGVSGNNDEVLRKGSGTFPPPPQKRLQIPPIRKSMALQQQQQQQNISSSNHSKNAPMRKSLFEYCNKSGTTGIQSYLDNDDCDSRLDTDDLGQIFQIMAEKFETMAASQRELNLSNSFHTNNSSNDGSASLLSNQGHSNYDNNQDEHDHDDLSFATNSMSCMTANTADILEMDDLSEIFHAQAKRLSKHPRGTQVQQPRHGRHKRQPKLGGPEYKLHFSPSSASKTEKKAASKNNTKSLLGVGEMENDKSPLRYDQGNNNGKTSNDFLLQIAPPPFASPQQTPLTSNRSRGLLSSVRDADRIYEPPSYINKYTTRLHNSGNSQSYSQSQMSRDSCDRDSYYTEDDYNEDEDDYCNDYYHQHDKDDYHEHDQDKHEDQRKKPLTSSSGHSTTNSSSNSASPSHSPSSTPPSSPSSGEVYLQRRKQQTSNHSNSSSNGQKQEISKTLLKPSSAASSTSTDNTDSLLAPQHDVSSSSSQSDKPEQQQKQEQNHRQPKINEYHHHDKDDDHEQTLSEEEAEAKAFGTRFEI